MSQALAYYIYARGKTYQYEQAKDEENELKILQHEKIFYLFTTAAYFLDFGQINNKVMCSLMDYLLWNLVTRRAGPCILRFLFLSGLECLRMMKLNTVLREFEVSSVDTTSPTTYFVINNSTTTSFLHKTLSNS